MTAPWRKAIDAVLATHDGKVVYDTEIVKNGAVAMLAVDPQNGQVVASQPVPPSGGAVGSGSSTPSAPTATLSGGASADKSLGKPPGSAQQHLPIPK